MASHSPAPGTDRAPEPRHRTAVVKDGYLPVNEILFDRAGAPSPFGEEVTFPLPLEALRYERAVATEPVEPHA